MEWFDAPGASTPSSTSHDEQAQPGLRFSCTQCGNCCSGPPGYVIVNDDEAASLAATLNLPLERFLAEYCEETSLGRSLKERPSAHGFDCIFLDRQSFPGRAVCSVYLARPAQCRAWPFWPSLLRSREAWEQGKRTCPGMDKGQLYPPSHIRTVRASIEGRFDPAR